MMIKKIYFLSSLEERFKKIVGALPRRSFKSKTKGESKIEEIYHVNLMKPRSLYPRGEVYGIWPGYFNYKH